MSRSVALIGLGQVAMGYDLAIEDPAIILTHARAFGSHPAFHVASGVDPDSARREAFASRYRAKASAEQVDPADIVVIASPTETHGVMLGKVLNGSLPEAVLCEKPLSYDLAEAQEMVKRARQKSCPLYVNYLRRAAPGVQEVKRRVDQGSIAGPLKGVAWYSKGLLHSGSHLVNMLEFWLGAIKGFQVVGKGRNVGSQDCEPDVRIDFALGPVTFFAAREEDFSLNEVELVAANGRLRYSGNSIVWQAAATDSLGYRILLEAGEELASDTKKMQWHVVDQLAAWLDGKDAVLCSGDDALRTLEWLTKIKDAT